MRIRFMQALSMLIPAALLASCAPRLRVDHERLRPIESIAPVTFIANRIVRPPLRAGQALPPMPNDPTLATAERIFALGVPAFFDALTQTERFEIVPSEKVLAAESYGKFPRLSGVNAGTAQLASGGWRLVTPDDGEKIAALLEEIDADAALITYWRFTLDPNMQGIGVDTAFPHAHMRAWLIGRDGKVIADDEFDVQADSLVGIHNQRYDGRSAAGMFSDPIETCAVRLVADLSNARSDARKKKSSGEAPEHPPTRAVIVEDEGVLD